MTNCFLSKKIILIGFLAPFILAGNCYCAEGKSSPEVEITDCGKVSPSAEVRMEESNFVPQTVTVPAEGVIKWTNVSEFTVHTATSGKRGEPGAGSRFDSGVVRIGKAVCMKFKKPGKYPYFCLPHPEMKDGIVIVK